MMSEVRAEAAGVSTGGGSVMAADEDKEEGRDPEAMTAQVSTQRASAPKIRSQNQRRALATSLGPWPTPPSSHCQRISEGVVDDPADWALASCSRLEFDLRSTREVKRSEEAKRSEETKQSKEKKRSEEAKQSVIYAMIYDLWSCVIV